MLHIRTYTCIISISIHIHSLDLWRIIFGYPPLACPRSCPRFAQVDRELVTSGWGASQERRRAAQERPRAAQERSGSFYLLATAILAPNFLRAFNKFSNIFHCPAADDRPKSQAPPAWLVKTESQQRPEQNFSCVGFSRARSHPRSPNRRPSMFQRRLGAPKIRLRVHESRPRVAQEPLKSVSRAPAKIPNGFQRASKAL